MPRSKPNRKLVKKRTQSGNSRTDRNPANAKQVTKLSEIDPIDLNAAQMIVSPNFKPASDRYAGTSTSAFRNETDDGDGSSDVESVIDKEEVEAERIENDTCLGWTKSTIVGLQYYKGEVNIYFFL